MSTKLSFIVYAHFHRTPHSPPCPQGGGWTRKSQRRRCPSFCSRGLTHSHTHTHSGKWKWNFPLKSETKIKVSTFSSFFPPTPLVATSSISVTSDGEKKSTLFHIVVRTFRGGTRTIKKGEPDSDYRNWRAKISKVSSSAKRKKKCPKRLFRVLLQCSCSVRENNPVMQI